MGIIINFRICVDGKLKKYQSKECFDWKAAFMVNGREYAIFS